jgi:hypothetical protein
MIHRYNDYRWLRGFNMIPSWGARIEQAWWDYDGDRFRAEAALSIQANANCIRLWIEFTAWMADPARVQAAFMDAVDGLGELDLLVIPCLFNRWHDLRYDYGGTYAEDLYRDLTPRLEYAHELVAPLAGDPRILMWDLCNEPQVRDLSDPIAGAELAWLARVADTVRRAGVEQPLTIGTHQAGDNMDIYAPLCDVLCCHPYGQTPAQLDEMLAVCGAVQRRHAKPMHSNETIPGCLDDGKRADCACWTIARMEDAGYGWMGWGMREGRAVSTRRDRYDDNGIDRQGFHAWFTHDGKLRPGLEFLQDEPRFQRPRGTP